MKLKLYILTKIDSVECAVIQILKDYLLVETNRSFNEKFTFDIKIPEICGEESIKCEIFECRQIKPEIFHLKISSKLLDINIKKKLEKFSHTYTLKRFGLAVGKAVGKVLESVLKVKLENVKYSVNSIDTFHFVKSVVIGVEGEITGSAVLSFENKIREIVANKMWAFGKQIELTDEKVIEALKEFANFTLGNTVTILSNNMGIKSDIRTPLILDDKYISAGPNLELQQVIVEFDISGQTHKIMLILLQAV